MGFSVVIPCYNEEKSIRAILTAMVSDLEKYKVPYEIIVVDDCSSDGTREEILALGLKVTLIEHRRNLGYGAALKSGIKNSAYDLIVITDADGTYPNSKIPALVSVAKKENWDMVVGARTGQNVNIPLVRKPAKWFISRLANFLCGTNIPDLNSGLRVMKKEVVERFLHILPEGFSFTSTITLAMLTNGYTVQYTSIDYFKREGKSKIHPVKDTLNFIQLIIRTVLYFNPLKVFIPFSFFLILLAVAVFIGSWLLLGKAMDVTFGVILMTSVIVLAIGMLADLIDKRVP
ncbi:MAG: glycosyltransferase family 2 protein [Nitrospinota bacterium]